MTACRSLVMALLVAACSPAAAPTTSTAAVTPAPLAGPESDATPRLTYDGACTYEGPAPIVSPASNLVEFEFHNEGGARVLFAVADVAGRRAKFRELVEAGLDAAALPPWAEVVERRTVEPGGRARALPDLATGPHALLCHPGDAASPWQLAGVVDVLVG